VGGAEFARGAAVMYKMNATASFRPLVWARLEKDITRRFDYRGTDSSIRR